MASEEARPKLDNFRKVPGTKCYRTSKPEGAAAVAHLKELEVRTIVDLRSPSEDRDTDMMDKVYAAYTLQIPYTGGPGERPTLIPLAKGELDEEVVTRRRVIVPMCFTSKLIKEAPWYIQLLALICKLIDQLFGSSLVNWLLVRLVLNPRSAEALPWLFRKMLIDDTKEIASVLHLLCLPDFVPGVLVCMLGKDRTGLMSSLLSHICRQPLEDIIDDYAKSEREIPSTCNTFQKMDKLGVHPAYKRSPPECLHGAYTFINERFGSLDKYLESIGFDGECQERLRKNISCDG